MNWDKIKRLDTFSRTAIVSDVIRDGQGIQNEVCKLAGLSPKTCRKYRDENIEVLNECYEKVDLERSIKTRNNLCDWVFEECEKEDSACLSNEVAVS